KFPEARANVQEYVAKTWMEWAQAERPRRETIDIYDRLFSLQQALKLEGSDRPLEIVWGIGVARWKLPPQELDHPILEQMVVTEPSDEPTYVPTISGIGEMFGTLGAPSAPKSIDDIRAAGEQAGTPQFFFPKPFNEEQISIVERLENPDVDGVVVQGPPGTGK